MNVLQEAVTQPQPGHRTCLRWAEPVWKLHSIDEVQLSIIFRWTFKWPYEHLNPFLGWLQSFWLAEGHVIWQTRHVSLHRCSGYRVCMNRVPSKKKKKRGNWPLKKKSEIRNAWSKQYSVIQEISVKLEDWADSQLLCSKRRLQKDLYMT